MGKYFDEMKRTMEWLAEQPRTLFMGQAVGSKGTFLSATLEDVPEAKRLELPVCESFQMQVAMGMALEGVVPISVYPRQNFMLLATSEIVNMIDKLSAISVGEVTPSIIIRTAAGTTRPINPGHQHVGNYAAGLRAMVDEVEIVELHESSLMLHGDCITGSLATIPWSRACSSMANAHWSPAFAADGSRAVGRGCLGWSV